MNKINIGMMAFTIWVVSLATTHAQFGGFKKKLLGGGESDSVSPVAASTVTAADVRGKLDASILEVGLARKKLLEAQLKLLEALGKKEAADAILSSSNVAREGGVAVPKDASEIDESVKVSEELNAELEAFEDQTVTLNEEQKEIFRSAKGDFSEGLILEAGQVAILVVLVKEAKDVVTGLKKNPFKAREALALSAGAGKLASVIPGDVKAMHGTWKLMQKVGADNQIEVEDIDIGTFLAGPGGTAPLASAELPDENVSVAVTDATPAPPEAGSSEVVSPEVAVNDSKSVVVDVVELTTKGGAFQCRHHPGRRVFVIKDEKGTEATIFGMPDAIVSGLVASNAEIEFLKANVIEKYEMKRGDLLAVFANN